MVEKGPLTTMKLGSTGMSTSHWCAIVALWFAPGTKEGHGTAQSARTYSFQSRILPTGYKVTSYDETKRRRSRGWTGVYFTQARKRATRDSIQTGAALLARVSGGQGGSARPGAKRRKLFAPTE